MASSNDDSIGFQYLEEAKHIFEDWKQSGLSGLTSETFVACTQTIGAIPDLVKYLYAHHEIEYVLPGKLLSDPIEGRFGWYRQVNGGNFYVSVKQILLAEKKIRCLSLFDQQTLLSATTMDTDKLAIFNFPLSNIPITDTLWLVEFFRSISLDDDVPISESVVVYFVSGYIARSIIRRRKCLSCKNLLVDSSDAPDLQSAVPDEHRELFEMANRGGLSSPSEYTFAVATLGAKFYHAMINGPPRIMQEFYKRKNHQQVFVHSVHETLCSNDMLQCLLSKRCNQLHSNFELILSIIFNCFAKNELKRINAQSMANELVSKTTRVCRKLTSKGSVYFSKNC